MLHFLPAILLLLVNGHLSGTGDFSQWLFTERVIQAWARPLDEPRTEVPPASMRLAVRALAWVTRWQNPCPDIATDEGSDSKNVVLGKSEPLKFLLIVKAGDRSRDGPFIG